jgi:hypothetical protein
MEKYGNKSPLMRIFHKYTGIILVASVASVIVLGLLYSESQDFYFEDYQCNQIVMIIGDERTPAESIRYEEILKECTEKAP